MVICGAGIIGSAIAYYLAMKGIVATVVERASVACASSGDQFCIPQQLLVTACNIAGPKLVQAAGQQDKVEPLHCYTQFFTHASSMCNKQVLYCATLDTVCRAK